MQGHTLWSVSSTAPHNEGDRAGADLVAYDTFGYDNVAFRATHADWLCTLAAIHGLEVADLDDVRVLELGCGRGGNLVAMADDIPTGTFTGIDHAPSQIADGRDLARRAGVVNCTLVAADLVDAATDEDLLGRDRVFDVIICHGVYSWVPDAVRAAIRSIVATRLAPAGVASISFNALPGWHARRIVRDALRRVVPDGPPAQMAATAREFLALWREHGGDAGPLSGFMQHEFDLLDRLSDRYLYFEHLVEHNQAFYLDEFVDDMAASGLTYLGDADPGTSSPAQLGDDGAEQISALGLDAVATEQLLDVMTNRFFRRAVLCRADARRSAGGAAVMPRLRIGADVDLVTVDVDLNSRNPDASAIDAAFVDAGGSTLTPHDPTTATMLWVLSEHRPDTMAVADLIAEVAARRSVPIDEVHDDVCELAHELVMRGRCDAGRRDRGLASAIADHPIARQLARVQAMAGDAVITTGRHDHLAVDTMDRVLLRVMDGTCDHDNLLGAVTTAVATGELRITDTDGDPVDSPVDLAELVVAKLERFRVAGVLMRRDSDDATRAHMASEE